MSPLQAKALIQRYYDELWNRWDFSLVDELIDETLVFRGSLGIDVRGREGFKEYMRTVRRVFPDLHNDVNELVAEDNKVVARLTYTGTHRDELFGYPATGRRISYAGTAFFRIAGERIAEGWVLGNLQSLTRQLGHVGIVRDVSTSPPGPVVSLRQTTPEDLDYVLEAERGHDNAQFILPWTREQHAKALGDADLSHQIILRSNGERVGFLLLAGLTNPHGSIEFRRIVITAKGEGLGRAAIRLVKRFAFVERAAHRLWLDVKSQNQRARRLYEQEGFISEGMMRECVRSATGFDSLVIMSMLSSQYR